MNVIMVGFIAIIATLYAIVLLIPSQSVYAKSKKLRHNIKDVDEIIDWMKFLDPSWKRVWIVGVSLAWLTTGIILGLNLN